MSPRQGFFFLFGLLFAAVYGLITNCPLSQTRSTHLICKILKNTNIDQVLPAHNFSDNNYCLWNFTNTQKYMNCTANNDITDIVMEEVDINGTLDLTVPWPSTMKQIDFEQYDAYSNTLYGAWNWTSFITMSNFYELDLRNNQISGAMSSADFDVLASIPSFKHLWLGSNNFEINFTDISLNLNLSALNYLDLKSNKAYGRLDTSIKGFFSHFPNLITFAIGGQISNGNGELYGNFANLDCISTANLPQLEIFRISWNEFSGSLALSPGHFLSASFLKIAVDYNNFDSIDWSIFYGLYNLHTIDIKWNALTGIIDWNVISDLVVNGSLRVIELNGNHFEGYADFSWIPFDIALTLNVDSDIGCDPIIYQCLGSNTLLNRTFTKCTNKTHCESACQCSTQSTDFYTTVSPTTLAPNPNTSVCSEEYDGYIESTYQAAMESGLCIEGALFVDVLSQIMDIIDITYNNNNLQVYTTMRDEEISKYFEVEVCGNVSMNVVTCFDNKTNETALIKLSESNGFEEEINDEILISNISTNDTVLIIYITDIVIIYSISPTTTPTIPPTLTPFAQSDLFIAIVIGACLLLLCILALILYIYCKKRSLQNKRCFISNGLVIIVTIGDYEGAKVADNADIINADLSNLPVEKDAENLIQLFTLLNYKIIPMELQLNWTAKQIINFFREDIGNELFDNQKSLRYDALLVFLSCHGKESQIITSDHMTIDKTVLHRILSCKYPTLRDIPRIFLWDSCEGYEQREHNRSSSSIIRLPTINLEEYGLDDILIPDVDEKQDLHKNVAGTEMNKGIELTALNVAKNNLWTNETKNPDYNLAQIHAANIGFQAKCHLRFGSYLTYYFVEKMRRNIENKENKSLQTICQEIQTELHDLGKQQTIHTFNNNTGFLHFKANNTKNHNSNH